VASFAQRIAFFLHVGSVFACSESAYTSEASSYDRNAIRTSKRGATGGANEVVWMPRLPQGSDSTLQRRHRPLTIKSHARPAARKVWARGMASPRAPAGPPASPQHRRVCIVNKQNDSPCLCELGSPRQSLRRRKRTFQRKASCSRPCSKVCHPLNKGQICELAQPVWLQEH
jgi:hypothetical protein